MKKIYGNNYLLSTLSHMAVRKRCAQSVLFYGETGTGKKLMAEYYTMLLLCENPKDGKPCGICAACRNAENHSHPDVVYANTSGKSQNYSVDEARNIRSDAFIRPNNNSGKKVYIFRDCRNVDQRTQNALLKIIEEPPDYAHFIFTTESKQEFLPTIISRCTCFGLNPCTEEDTKLALSENGFSQGEIERAVSCFHGNIGMCINYLTDEKLRNQVDLTKSITDSIIKKDEYELNVLFFKLGKERNDIKTVLSMLDKIFRDAAVISENREEKAIGCYRIGAEGLSDIMTFGQAVKLRKSIETAWKTINLNVNAVLALSALCAEIAETLE